MRKTGRKRLTNLILGRKRIIVEDQIAKRYAVSLLGALGLQRILLYPQAERMSRSSAVSENVRLNRFSAEVDRFVTGDRLT